MNEEVTAQQILDEGLAADEVGRQHFPASVVQIIETIGPDGQPYLWTRRDTQSGSWKHLGMIEMAANDIRAASLDKDDDG